ncbi:hypothetical protein [Candidatus Poriferisodalis sp.]|uniref:hypothetical protein n=1 Tax=Candidatus Poriferisodalis sp. TaxID=3101277 RepID=UPI003B5952B7
MVAVLGAVVIVISGCAAEPGPPHVDSLPATTTAIEPSTPTITEVGGEEPVAPSESAPESPVETAVQTTTTAASLPEASESVENGGSSTDAEPDSEPPQTDQTSDQADTSQAALHHLPVVIKNPPHPEPLANNRVSSMWRRLRVPPRSYGELVPQAPFRGLVSSEVDYEPGDHHGAPLLRYFDTTSKSLVELRIGEAAVTSCYWAMWPERDGLHLSFEEATGDSLSVVHAEWGKSPQALPRSALDDSEWWQRRVSASHMVSYANGQIELEHSDTGFVLRYGDLVREYTLHLDQPLSYYGGSYPNRYLPRMAIPPSLLDGGELADAVYGEIGRRWYPYLAGTDGQILGIEVVADEPACSPVSYLFLISLRDGVVRSCTWTYEGQIALVTTADAADEEAWLDEIELPPKGSIYDGLCTAFDGDLALLATLETPPDTYRTDGER